MFVENSVEPSVRWGMKRPKRSSVMRCDNCSATFSRKYSAHYAARDRHYCGRKCTNVAQKKGGSKHAAVIATCREKWGVDNPQQAPEIRRKTEETNIRRYGNRHAIASDSVRTKIEKAYEDRYGCHPTQLDETKAKMIATRIERYGSAAPIHDDPEVAGRYRETMLERHGVESPLQSEAVWEKARETWLERYGVDNPLSAGSHFRKREDHIKGGQAGYRSLARRRKHDLFSKPEVLLLHWLEERFGKDDVEHQALVEHTSGQNWLIDFYVRSIDTYIELDGVFWHGLDRPYEELHENIRTVFDKDRRKDAWFASHKMKLVRITDQQLLQYSKDDNFSSVIEQLGG